LPQREYNAQLKIQMRKLCTASCRGTEHHLVSKLSRDETFTRRIGRLSWRRRTVWAIVRTLIWPQSVIPVMSLWSTHLSGMVISGFVHSDGKFLYSWDLSGEYWSFISQLLQYKWFPDGCTWTK